MRRQDVERNAARVAARTASARPLRGVPGLGGPSVAIGRSRAHDASASGSVERAAHRAGQRRGGELVARQLGDDLAAAEGQHAVADVDQLLDVRGDHDVGGARLAVGQHHAVDLGLGADVDADGRILQHDDPVFLPGPAGQHDLLLVAARQRADVAVRIGSA